MHLSRQTSFRFRLGLILWVAITLVGLTISLVYQDLATANLRADFRSKTQSERRLVLSALENTSRHTNPSQLSDALTELATGLQASSGSGLRLTIRSDGKLNSSPPNYAGEADVVIPIEGAPGYRVIFASDPTTRHARESQIALVTLLCCLKATLFGAIIAGLLACALVRSDQPPDAVRIAAKGWRTGVLEIILCGVCGGVALMGFLAIQAQRSMMNDLGALRVAQKPHGQLISSSLVPWSAEAINHRLEVALWLSIGLSVACLVIMRVAVRQQSELLLSKSDNRTQRGAFDQVSTNLPIGFFTFANGAVRETNSVINRFARPSGVSEGEGALESILALEDRERVLTLLQDSEIARTPFSTSFKVTNSSGQVRSVESRGAPVYDSEGHFDHLIGFLVDVTDRVEAHQLLKATNERLSDAFAELEVNFEATVHSLVKVVEAKDPYTAGHSSRVTAYSMRIGRAIGLDATELHTLEMGTLIHDIGKIGIPDAVLTKPAGLTEAEFALIKQHPSIGARMVEDIPAFEACLPIVLLHHERLNGSGYPFGLTGEAIPLLVRIAAVADCFDALTSDRSYRRARSKDEAIAELRKSADQGTLDPEIVAILAETVDRDGLLWISNQNQAA